MGQGFLQARQTVTLHRIRDRSRLVNTVQRVRSPPVVCDCCAYFSANLEARIQSNTPQPCSLGEGGHLRKCLALKTTWNGLITSLVFLFANRAFLAPMATPRHLCGIPLPFSPGRTTLQNVLLLSLLVNRWGWDVMATASQAATNQHEMRKMRMREGGIRRIGLW